MAHQGWDSLTIDLQHGVVDYQAMVDDAAGDLHHATVPWCACPGWSPAS
jgi:4-hydroxy-2-oxoheptanedioate aldolase